MQGQEITDTFWRRYKWLQLMQAGFLLEGYGDHHVDIGKVLKKKCSRTLQRDFVLFYIMHTHIGIRNSSDVATRKNLMIDKYTKVICQGFTGKQVLNHSICMAMLSDVPPVAWCSREQSTVSRPLLMAQTWLEVFPQEKEAPPIWVYLCSIALRRYWIYQCWGGSVMCVYICTG